MPRRRTLFKATLGAATVAVVGTAVPARAAPGAAFPWILDCDGWGARPPTSPPQTSTITTNKILVHHTAYPNSTDYSRDQAVWLARDIQRLHMDVNGWSDTGQHFTVSRGGYVLEGRHGSLGALDGGVRQVVGAHCPGENGNAIGIENEGTYVTETPPEALTAALVRLCVAVCRQYGLHAYDVFGHWDFRETECPGAAFYRQFPALRRRIAGGLHMSPSAAPARRWTDIWRFVGGPVVKVGQRLLVGKGYALAPNGTFGTDTVAAVQDWQARNGIPVDVDATFTAPTWETLAPSLSAGATGSAVTGLQEILRHRGWAVTPTGTYDPATTGAVRGLQRLHGLQVTGSTGSSTWCAAVGGIVREAFRPA
jgi:peptidoglycan hydrolase-like protein with peptidoglycan-binding domain